MDPKLEELARIIRAHVADDTSKAIAALETRLEHRMQIHLERMEGLVQRAAEGYGATLVSIDRRFDRLETKCDTQIADHGRVLRDHGRRISALEHERE